ncbi:Wadjet anti-phage system protein JetD domain-containing protein [Streptomyces sp. NPDC086549]|uniref:Wadjet anti-phage system protein JetD domain-containing protein n=1 Tax=Streptomyces sp. NPDC086549 TaxID=3365752 RepID=UPI00380BE3B1
MWGAGYATHGLVAFLKAMAPLPVAAWQDLDAHGIRIIANLTDRTGRCITPVGMNVDLYRNGTKYRQKPEKRAENLKIAEELSVSGPLPLRALAAEIARNGGDACEHETLYDDVLPSLSVVLEQIIGSTEVRDDTENAR